MKRSKRIEVLDQRPVNKDGFIDEWPEMGFVSMHSPYDPKPSVKIEDGIITELDGKKRDEFDFLDQFIADYAIRADRAEASMAIPSLEIARKIVDIHVSRKEILEIVSGITPAKMVEVINYLNVVELMMGMQKMRARKVPGNQALIILQDCLRATSYDYKGFSFFSLFPKKIELHHSYIVCRRTAHSFHCTVKKFVVLHLIKDFQFFWIYVMAVCHLA